MGWHIRSAWWMFLCLVWMLVQGPGCSSKGPQYPEDHARYQRIDAAVETLRKAYVEKNFSELKKMLLPSDQLERAGREILLDFQTFQEITLDLSIDRIMIEDEAIDVSIHWQGRWKRNATDAGTRGRGHGRLRFVGVQSILLREADGDLPFGMANRVMLSEPRPADSL